MHVHFIQEKPPPFHTTDHPAKSCIAAEVPNPRTDFLLIGKVQTGSRWAEGVVDGIHGPGLAFLGGWRWHACAKFFILGKVWEDQE
jgi:hypothetical protein